MSQNSNLNPKIKKGHLIDANYLFIDGISRSGKTSLAPVVSTFNKVEHFRDKSFYSRIIRMYESGNINQQGFDYMFETELLIDVWFSMMGRDVNNNIHDLTSIINSHKRKEYLERANRKDTPVTFEEIVKEIKNRQLIFSFVTSDFTVSADLLRQISSDFKYIVVMRNPIDMVFTWFRSKRVTRLGTDKRYIPPAFQIKNFDNLPLSMINNAEEYNKANPLEKCFLIIENEMTKYMNAEILNSKNTCLVPIENYWTETEKYIKIFESFLNTNRSEFTNNEMAKNNIPRKKDSETFSIKASMIFDNMSEKYIDRLKNLCQRYEAEISDIYKLSSITKFPKGKFKGLSNEVFTKISPSSKYTKGKRIL